MCSLSSRVLQLVFLLAALTATPTVHGIRFTLLANQQKCFQELVHKNELVTGDFEVTEAQGHSTNVTVVDSRSYMLYTNAAGQHRGNFAFSSDSRGLITVCLSSGAPGQGRGELRYALLNVIEGAEAKSYDQVARAEKLRPLETEVRRLEDMATELITDMEYMRQRQDQMTTTNTSTMRRMNYLSLVSITVLLVVVLGQVLYLRRYFKSKKLID